MAEFITETSAKAHREVVRVRRAIRKVDTNGIAVFRKTDLTDAYREYNSGMYHSVMTTGCHQIYVDFEMENTVEDVAKLVDAIKTIDGVMKVEWSGRMGNAIEVMIEVN